MLVIDGSGSMSGSAIDQARESAELFIRDLPLEAGDTSSATQINIVFLCCMHHYVVLVFVHACDA